MKETQIGRHMIEKQKQPSKKGKERKIEGATKNRKRTIKESYTKKY